MASSMTFQNGVPASMILPQQVSTSKSILRKQLMELLPTEQTTYGPDNNDIMRFNIASNSDFINFAESYFKWKFQMVSTDRDKAQLLSIGGMHSLIKSLEIRALQSGTLIQRYDNYNKYYAMKSLSEHSPEYVDRCLNTQGDSLGQYANQDPGGECQRYLECIQSIGLSRVDQQEERITILISKSAPADEPDGLQPSHIQVGSRVIAHLNVEDLQSGALLTDQGLGNKAINQASTTYYADIIVDSITVINTTSFTIVGTGVYHQQRSYSPLIIAENKEYDDGGDGDQGAAVINQDTTGYATKNSAAEVLAEPGGLKNYVNTSALCVYRGGKGCVEPRFSLLSLVTAAATTRVETVCLWKPFASLMNHLLPLFLMRGGIEVKVEFDRGAQVMYNCAEAGATAIPTYTVTAPRLMGMMITPHNDIVEEYLQAFNSPKGILYSIPSVRTRRVTGKGSETAESLQVHVGVRSARRVIVQTQDSTFSDGNTVAALNFDSCGTSLRSKLSKYQFKIGAHEFPNRDVVLDTQGNEAYEQYKMMMNAPMCRMTYGDTLQTTCYNTSGKAANQYTMDSRHFFFGADLSRDNGPDSFLTGSDLSIVPLDMNIERSFAHEDLYSNGDGLGWDGQPVYFMYVEHDAVLKLGRDEIVVLS